jgi:spermidine/putrescine transport system substrate-binding protein
MMPPVPAHRIDRRSFLRGAAAGAAAVPLAGVLAACVRDAPPGAAPSPTRANPATLPLHEDLLVPGAARIERGATLRVYQWREYLADEVLEGFVRRHGADDVDVQVESFADMDEALARLRGPDGDFDVFFPTIDVLPRLVQARLLRPLTHELLPNLPNLWPEFRPDPGPFYDRGARYSVPYTVYSSGIAWRTDLVQARDASRPLDLPWNPRYRGRTGFLDQYREALGLALLREGLADVNTVDPDTIARAAAALREAVLMGASLTEEGAYEDLPEGRVVAHQAWSGDLLTALTYEGHDPVATGRTLAYWWPMDGTGWVGCDLTAICARGRSPVLAHAFVDHLLDEDVAFRNFLWNGYQPPLDAITRDIALRTYPGLSEVGHHCAILDPQGFAASQMLHALDPRSNATWLDAWQSVLAVA